MQNSELYRRGFVAPRNQDALADLRACDVSDATAVEYAKIASQEDFELLWTKKFFDEIRECTGANVDDYEEDEIEASRVRDLASLAKKFAADTSLPDRVRQFCESLAAVSANAEKNGMPVFAIL